MHPRLPSHKVPPPAVRGDIAKGARLARRLVLREVAASTGIHVATLSLIENGHREGRTHLYALAHYFGVSPAVLAGQVPALSSVMWLAGVTTAELASKLHVPVEQVLEWEGDSVRPMQAREVAQLLFGDARLWTAFTLTGDGTGDGEVGT